MNLAEWFAKLDEDREARTRRERHGQGELTLIDGIPTCATGCLLPDGTLTDAECLLAHTAGPDETSRVWTRRLPASVLRRRGRLIVNNGSALFFVDELDADQAVSSVEPIVRQPNLEHDLGLSPRLRNLVRSDVFATLLYGALCNTVWLHKATGTVWSCSWRKAGGIVATLRCRGDYVDWYCVGGEGLIDEQVLAEIEMLGWELTDPLSRQSEPSG